MSDFKIVPDSLRTPRTRSGLQSEVLKALHDGKTIFVPLNGETEQAVRMRVGSSAPRRGFKSNTRRQTVDGVEGIVAWWTPKDGAK